MYRRNIKHILLLLVGVIGIFVLYHAWVKRNYFPDPPPSPPNVVSEDHASAPGNSVAPQQAASTPEAKRPRTVDPVTIPVTKHSELLGSIHEELEKRNLSVAETKLAEIPSSMLAELATRRHVAILWNNLGILQERDGGTEASVKAFKKAVTLDPQNAVAYLNLAHAYWGLRDPALTQDFLHKVSTLAPDEPFPHLALADLLQEQDMIKEASRHLSDAKARIKKDPGLQSYLTSVTMKVQRTEKIEDKLSAHSTVHFTVKYDGNEDPATWVLALDILEEAYREIGQKFNHFPSRPMIVVLHTKDQFQGATGSPGWADGLFDPVLDRIHIPTQGATTDRAWLTRVLRHEFVHALIQDELGAAGGTVPTWLNEGLAMQLSGDQWQELKDVLQAERTLIPLTTLEASWEKFPPETASVAYAEASSAAHYLIDRFGMHKVHAILSQLKARQTITAAIQDKLLMSYDRFQQQWADNVGGKLGQSKL